MPSGFSDPADQQLSADSLNLSLSLLRPIPDALIVSHFPHGPTVYFTLHNVVLRHDIASHSTSTISEQYPHLVFNGFESKLGHRVMDVLRYLFPVPKEDSKRVMTFANEGDFVSFRCVLVLLFRSWTEFKKGECFWVGLPPRGKRGKRGPGCGQS
jgi:hypothetical protein